MAWDIRRTYYYLVCFATLLMTILGAVQVVQRALDLAYPRYWPPTVVELEQRFARPDGAERYAREELERMAEAEAVRSREMERQSALRGMLGSLALIGIAFPVYFYHWRQVRKLE